jgi:hypothetical protein
LGIKPPYRWIAGIEARFRRARGFCHLSRRTGLHEQRRRGGRTVRWRGGPCRGIGPLL